MRYDYGKVMAIFLGCVFAYVIVLVFIGPERLGRDMSDRPTEGEPAEEWGEEKEKAAKAIERV